MKKKFVLKITLIILAIILIVSGIILFCPQNNKISLIENIRDKIAKVGENLQIANGVTIKDVTNLEDNGNLEHEHIMKTMYDETKHWEECTICRQKYNEVNHTYIDKGWTMGNANNCHKDNVHEFVCSCGYKKIDTTGRKAHVWTAINNTDSYSYYETCKACNNSVDRNYHKCINIKNRKEINCTNIGRCSICGHNYTIAKHTLMTMAEKGKNMNCMFCNTYLGVINNAYVERIEDGKLIYYTNLTMLAGSNYSTPSYYSYDPNVSISNSSKRNGNVWENTQTIIYSKHSELCSTTRVEYRFTINGINANLFLSAKIKAEDTSPAISNITNQQGGELTEWSKSKPIIVSGTENYCNTVKVKILDENENIVFEGSGGVTNNNYQIKCIPEIECDENGKTFTVIVTDSLENITSQEFNIAKVDMIPPTPTSETEILGDWAKAKDFTFTATDYGIGQVQVAFNDIEDLKLATKDGKTFSRDYKFIGDVYSPKELSVIYKDGLGNTSIQKITIDKLDNTAPSITNTSIHNDIITIEAHDRHESLGEGSGVVKYRYLASEEKLTNPELTEENSTESANTEIKIKDIYKVKYIYIVAEDYVGNTSKVYEFKVPELILTSSVNLNTGDGKGEIILDWSSYDVSDKYFAVYRKKENQTDWEEIVPLTKKLTGKTYTDKLGNDEAKPEIPNITITGDTTNNNITMTANSTDNGANYKYYIEAYSSIGTLLSKSI